MITRAHLVIVTLSIVGFAACGGTVTTNKLPASNTGSNGADAGGSSDATVYDAGMNEAAPIDSQGGTVDAADAGPVFP